ncbi:MAG: hypothetical protein COY66_01940 [Candidatus Kerfeldbacteria bacterium CG_4_10_14_0_8_um_filter_42_10]|uniref:Thymidylate kinase n=1 Tax=Candidatus Kerfeldbacteria bacterium CG_4_10_14_0_8_um_filter_42_10 TaxID=2014248 RepID=A0A2M7RJI9_9BACT|nr:MAG: hypothetical protein COY66_01940 [Candidatus Kerfeldbacteria bacterium CG_4_10_14_0_8_um_filter_42_10]
MKKGKLIVIDGIDGSGKGTAVNVLADWAKGKKLRILDLKDYWKKNHTFPEPAEIKKYQVIISNEPTFSMVGQAIREEIIRDNSRDYSAYTTAEAYSLDREVLYQRVIIPALKSGKIVFQERSLSTSLVYQPIQAEPVSLKKILNLSGNKLALKYRPDLLIITILKPQTAINRLKRRTEKKDQAIFEKLKFLHKADKRFRSAWFRRIFESKGTKVVYLNTEKSAKVTGERLSDIWENFLVTSRLLI